MIIFSKSNLCFVNQLYCRSILNRSYHILCTGAYNHWVCIQYGSNLNKEVFVMDSYSMESLDEDLVVQIASIYKCDGKVLSIRNLSVQQQNKGSVDCGLFAVAYALEACRGSRGIETNFMYFDQPRMRKHMLKCLEKKFLDPFPRHNDDKIPVCKQSSEFVELYCDCRMPEWIDENMLACNACKRWLHLQCIGFSLSDVPDVYLCRDCST